VSEEAARANHAVAPFTLDVFEHDEPYAAEEGIAYVRSRIEKSFTGDLEATSTVEMLSVRGEGDGGAGYVALETVRGTLKGRTGTFALLHLGTMSGDDVWARWPVSPGSGTGALAGIRGEAKIDIAPDGAHTLFLDYDL
jgi:Protein of unknown function (DUF3224)